MEHSEGGDTELGPALMSSYAASTRHRFSYRSTYGVNFNAGIFCWQLIIHLLQPLSIPLVWVASGFKTLSSLGFVPCSPWGSLSVVISVLLPALIWAVNLALPWLRQRSDSELVVGQIGTLNVLFGFRCFLIAVKYAFLSPAEYDALQRGVNEDGRQGNPSLDYTLIGGWATPSRAAITRELQAALQRTRCGNTSACFAITPSEAPRFASRVQESMLQDVIPGLPVVDADGQLSVSLECVFLTLLGEVLKQEGYEARDPSQTKVHGWLKRQRAAAAVFGAVMCFIDIPIYMMHGDWPSGAFVVAAMAAAKLLIFILSDLFYLFLAVGSLDYRRRYECLKLVALLVECQIVDGLKPAVYFNAMDNAVSWYQLVKLVRGFGKVYYSRIQFMFSFFVVTILACTLLLGLLLVSGGGLHFGTDKLREFILASSAVVANHTVLFGMVFVIVVQLLNAVSWGYKANKLTFRLRSAVLEQNLMLMQSSGSDYATAPLEAEPMDPPSKQFGHQICSITKTNSILRIIHDQLITDNLAKPLKLLGFRVDDGLIRGIWAVVATGVSIFSRLMYHD